MIGEVISVSLSSQHTFSKNVCERIVLIKGMGVEGDAHSGKTVKHRSRVAIDPTQPNLRQVHIIHAELFDELKAEGYDLAPGALGENILSKGIDLLSLPRNALLRMGESAVVQVTGLRNPCKQIEHFKKGLLAQVVSKDSEGNLVRKTGIMGIVLQGGMVVKGDKIEVELPAEPYLKLERV